MYTKIRTCRKRKIRVLQTISFKKKNYLPRLTFQFLLLQFFFYILNEANPLVQSFPLRFWKNDGCVCNTNRLITPSLPRNGPNESRIPNFVWKSSFSKLCATIIYVANYNTGGLGRPSRDLRRSGTGGTPHNSPFQTSYRIGKKVFIFSLFFFFFFKRVSQQVAVAPVRFACRRRLEVNETKFKH